MENDIRHVTAFLSLAITIRLGPTDVILEQSAYEPFPSSRLPRLSSRFRHFANFVKHRKKSIRSNKSGNWTAFEHRNRSESLDSPSSYYGCLRFEFPPLFSRFSILLHRKSVTVHEALRLLENLSNKMFSKDGWKRGEIRRRKGKSLDEIGKCRERDDELFVWIDLLLRRKRTFCKLMFYFVDSSPIY